MKLRKWEAHAGGGDPQGKPNSSCGGGSGPVWSVSSLKEVVPDSPSPMCSSPRTSAMDFSSEFFTPGHQNGLGGAIGGSNSLEPRSEVHRSVPDRRELLFFPPSDFRDLDLKWKQECSSPTTRQSMSTVYESTLTAMDQLVCQGSSSQETPKMEEFRSRLSRPRPYQEFLDEVQTHQHGSEMEAWKKATQLKLQTKLRRKEAAITNWEMEQKNKARSKMEIVERKIEIIRAKALKKMQKKIVEANKAAEKQRARERRAALKKMDRVAKHSEKIQATKCIICLKLQKLW